MAKRTTSSAKNAHRAVRSESGSDDSAKARREAVESIVIAIVLAFLFRAFEAEAFVIPTGSMAPTLQGRHKDVKCPECGYSYQAGASLDAEARDGPVQAVTCPMCFYTEEINRLKWSHASHTGDRILVNKFAYEPPFGNPRRWDVIVFKYPGNAKQNYIKRLVGLENETVKIRHGDVFRCSNDTASSDAGFQVMRKPPAKMPHMLQLVHDTRYLSESMKETGWPLNWQSESTTSTWESPDAGRSYHCQPTDETAWLNYRHFFVSFEMWDRILQGDPPPAVPQVVPITDFYAYNAQSRPVPSYDARGFTTIHPDWIGSHWVGDLAIEADVRVDSDAGSLLFDLVEAGRHHICEVDIATGQAKLSISDQNVTFQDDAGNPSSDPIASTVIQGQGRYDVRFANVDNQLVLWVNDKLVSFDQPTTYSPTPDDRPVTSDVDAGDLQPARIGGRGVDLTVNELRVLRDIYYVATDSEMQATDYRIGTDGQVRRMLKSPQNWRPGDLFDQRGEVAFRMEKGQFFALGDNSPFSKDGRLWGRDRHFVDRDMLIGKAVLIYWPHPLRVGIPGTEHNWPLVPNIRGMGLIR